MAYNLNHRANHTVEIDAELEAEAVEVERKQIIQQFRQQARVPGFRPGKAPVSAIRARFGSKIQSELQEQLTGRLLREVFEAEEDLHPLSNPRVSDLEFDDGGAFRFKASLEVRPHYELPSIDGLELPEVSLDVADAELDAELERFAEENATWEPADDDQGADGMLVEADLNGEMEDSDEEPYHEDNARFVLGEASVPPQINEALQAAKVGEQRFAERRFDDDDDNKQRAGKTVRYTIDVKALKRKVLPAVDDELAKTVGLESLDELKQRITEALQRNKRAQQRETWRRFVLDHMEEGIDTGELPPSLVQSAVGEDLNRFAYSMAMQGMAPDSAEVDWQEMAAKFEPGARTRVLDTLIAEQLADEWEVRVPEAEVDAVVTTEAQRQGLPPAEHKANLAKEGQLDSLRHSARISATIDEMIRRAGGEVE